MEEKDTEAQGLISSTFFSRAIAVDHTKVFPVMVLATMSSGKSTLINALLGEDILPSKNEACTAKVYSILDDDSMEEPKLYITSNDGHVNVIEENLAAALEEANNTDTVKDILISGDIKGVFNTDKALLVIDTPGPNNSRDALHESITKNVLDKLYGGLILYVMNATQMGINDDCQLLSILRAHMQKHKKVKVVFVINKMDAIDFEKESAAELICEIKKYIENNGIDNPDIIPVSALAANLFKKVLEGEKLTRSQYKSFLAMYELFRTSDIRMTSYAMTEEVPNRMNKIVVREMEYTVAEIMAAIENTGITYLENYIQEAQILSSENSSVKINLKSAVTKFSIEYHPYLLKYTFKKNGKRLSAYNEIRKRANTVLFRNLFEKSGNWSGLTAEIVKLCNTPEVEIHFTGRQTDYNDLKGCIDQYNGSAVIHLCFDKCHSDAELIQELDQIVSDAKSVIPQPAARNREGRNIYEVYS